LHYVLHAIYDNRYIYSLIHKIIYRTLRILNFQFNCKIGYIVKNVIYKNYDRELHLDLSEQETEAIEYILRTQ